MFWLESYAPKPTPAKYFRWFWPFDRWVSRQLIVVLSPSTLRECFYRYPFWFGDNIWCHWANEYTDEMFLSQTFFIRYQGPYFLYKDRWLFESVLCCFYCCWSFFFSYGVQLLKNMSSSVEVMARLVSFPKKRFCLNFHSQFHFSFLVLESSV